MCLLLEKSAIHYINVCVYGLSISKAETISTVPLISAWRTKGNCIMTLELYIHDLEAASRTATNHDRVHAKR